VEATTLGLAVASRLCWAERTRVQLKQVVLNLIMNGMKPWSAVEEPTTRERLVLRTQSGEINQVRYDSQDSGIWP